MVCHRGTFFIKSIAQCKAIQAFTVFTQGMHEPQSGEGCWEGDLNSGELAHLFSVWSIPPTTQHNVIGPNLNRIYLFWP